VKLVIQQEGQYTITLNQTDERCFERNVEYDYSNCKFVLAKILKQNDEGLDLEYMGGL
jgi:hypothetical protein